MKTFLLCVFLSLSTASVEAITLLPTPNNLEAELLLYIHGRGLHLSMPTVAPRNEDILNFLRNAPAHGNLNAKIYIEGLDKLVDCQPQRLDQGLDVINKKTVELTQSSHDPKKPLKYVYHCLIK